MTLKEFLFLVQDQLLLVKHVNLIIQELACKALRKAGYEIILINSNPASIMTDPEIANKTYIEPLTVDIVSQII